MRKTRGFAVGAAIDGRGKRGIINNAEAKGEDGGKKERARGHTRSALSAAHG